MTKISHVEKLSNTNIDEQTVIDYLEKHPDLLNRHPQTLGQLIFTHETGGAVSLVERQLKVLREENQSLKDKLSELVHIARENEELSQRFHRLAMELMAAEHLHDIVAMSQDQIQTFFYTDHVGFCFHDSLVGELNGLEKNILDSSHKQARTIRDWMHGRTPVFGPLDPSARVLLFGEHQQINSCALIPLYHTRDFGLLLLGSKSRDRFNDGMGTVFLQQLGELISSKLQLYLG